MDSISRGNNMSTNKAADTVSGANTGNKCLSCILEKKRKLARRKTIKSGYSPAFCLKSLTLAIIPNTKVIKTPTKLGGIIIDVSDFQNPKKPQKLNAFIEVIGYWLSVAKSL